MTPNGPEMLIFTDYGSGFCVEDVAGGVKGVATALKIVNQCPLLAESSRPSTSINAVATP